MDTKKLILLSLAIGLISKAAYGCGDTYEKDKAMCDKVYSKTDLTRVPDGVLHFCTDLYLGKCDIKVKKASFPKKETVVVNNGINQGATPWK